MSRKIITKNDLNKVNEKYKTEQRELIISILTESEKLIQKSGERGTFKKGDEEIAAKANIDSMIAQIESKPLEKEDSYSERLMKYIPTEIIALYLTFDTIIRSSSEDISTIRVIYWMIFFFCILAIILFLIRKDKVTSLLQITISVGAFVVWVFALGGPFLELFDWYKTLYGALLLPAYTFLVPFLKPET